MSTQIRHTHPYGFRSGQWADIKAVVPEPYEFRTTPDTGSTP